MGGQPLTVGPTTRALCRSCATAPPPTPWRSCGGRRSRPSRTAGRTTPTPLSSRNRSFPGRSAEPKRHPSTVTEP